MKLVQDGTVGWIADSWVTEPAPDGLSTFGVLRMPYDHAVSHRPGARFGRTRS